MLLAKNGNDMKKYLYLIILILIGNISTAEVSQIERQMKSLLDKKEFFRMRTLMLKDADKMSDEKKLYFNAYIQNVFNQNEKSIKSIENLLNNYGFQLNDTAKAYLLILQQDNYYKTFQYDLGSSIGEEILDNYTQVLDSTRIDDIENSNTIWNALSDTGPQRTIIKENVTIPWKRDKAGLMNIPVRFKDSLYDFIFDTGANLSSISRSMAEKLGLKIFNVTFDVGSSTGIQNKSALGLADSLLLGDIVVKNVVFLVIPDELVSFPEIGYYVNGIIGYPIIEQLREVRINRNGVMTIPEKPVKSGLNNLALDGLMPIVSFRTDKDTLCFHFDTGAKHTDLFKPYLDKYKTEIMKEAELDTVKIGGGGGFVNTEVYKLKNFVLYVGNKKVVLPEVNVRTKDLDDSGDIFYGNIGQDLISQFNEMIINFEYMYVDFK